MSMVITCTSCQKKLTLKEEFGGRRLKCPVCGTLLTAPARAVPVHAAVQASPVIRAVPLAQPIARSPESALDTTHTAAKDDTVDDSPGPERRPKKKKESAPAKRGSGNLLLYGVIGGGVLIFIAAASFVALTVP